MKYVRLRTKFILFLVAALLLPLALLSYVATRPFVNSLQIDAERFGSQLTETVNEKIGSFLVSQIQAVDNLALFYGPDSPISTELVGNIIEDTLYRNSSFESVIIADADGQEVINKDLVRVVDPSELKNISDTESFQTVREKGLYIGPLYFEKGRPFFLLGRSIVDRQRNFSGVVLAQVDAKILPEVMKNISVVAGKGGRVYMVDHKGTVIAHPDISYILSERSLITLPPIRSIVASSTHKSSEAYTNEVGENVLGSSRQVSIEIVNDSSLTPTYVNWFVIAEQPIEAVFDVARKVSISSLLITVVGVILASFAAAIFVRRITNPLIELHTASLEIGKGNLAYRAEVKSNDEVGDLAKSFNTMAKTLATSIDSLKQSELKSLAERDKLSIILSGITNAVISVDMDKNIILFNRAAETMTGFKASDVMGKPVGDIITIFDKDKKLSDEEYCPTPQHHAEGVVFSKNSLTLTTPKNTSHYVNLISGTIREGKSIGLGCILTLQDITREFLLDKMKGEFVSIAAHQLRTPLTGIKWSLNDLSEDLSSLSSTQAKMVGDSLAAANRMVALIDDLLSVSRIEEGRFGIMLRLQPLAPLVKRAAEHFEKAAVEKKITLQVDIAENLPFVNIDEEKFSMVIENILDNAVKYAFPGGKISFVVKKQEHEILISVHDTGIGISEFEFDRIFTKFFRSDQAMLKHTDGSGLGLYVVKNIVTQHGGEVWFASKPNEGTTFYISVPIPHSV